MAIPLLCRPPSLQGSLHCLAAPQPLQCWVAEHNLRPWMLAQVRPAAVSRTVLADCLGTATLPSHLMASCAGTFSLPGEQHCPVDVAKALLMAVQDQRICYQVSAGNQVKSLHEQCTHVKYRKKHCHGVSVIAAAHLAPVDGVEWQGTPGWRWQPAGQLLLQLQGLPRAQQCPRRCSQLQLRELPDAWACSARRAELVHAMLAGQMRAQLPRYRQGCSSARRWP